MDTQQRLQPAGNKILNTASQLVYARVLVGTRNDSTTIEAQVAKMNLYNNFASKEGLELAHMTARHHELREAFYQRWRTHRMQPIGCWR